MWRQFFRNLTVLWLLAVPASAQQIDTVVFEDRRQSFTILDQVEDPAERKAFQKLLDAKDPQQRLQRAELFLAEYPDSWLLAHAYEVAAKAAMDLGDRPRALLYGGKSLELFPENPMLLAPLANQQVQEGLLEEGAESARAALEYLDRFARPVKFSEKEWERIEPRLRAAAYFALGRAGLMRAIQGEPAQRNENVAQARRALRRSWRLNPGDPLTAYLLGLAEISAGRQGQAELLLAQAARPQSPVRGRALRELRVLFRGDATGQRDAFNEYVARLQSRSPELETLQPPTEKAQPEPARYAGSDSCRECHKAAHEAWSQTGMARMFRPYAPENVLADFLSGAEYPGADGEPAARMYSKGGRPYFSMRGDEGSWKRYRVDYTIGSKWQQAYATELPGGRIHVLPVQYSKLRGEWVNFWKIIDPPNSERARLESFNELSNLTNYQINCAPCHTSQLRAVRSSSRPQDLHFRDGGINCEMCHGPSQRHVEAMQAGEPYGKAPGEPPVEFGRIGHSGYVRICGQCHAQSRVLRKGPNGEMNYSGRRQPFIKDYRSQPYPEFSIKAFYKDGRFRETTFIVESLLRSACYKKGEVHCGHCHDPHPPDAAENLKSLKFRGRQDQMCLQCHQDMAANIAEHTRHPASSEASRCAACHMPRIMNSLLFRAGTHRIDNIPNPAMTARFGREHSPNACLLCHTEKDASWVKAQLDSWQ